MRDRMFCADCGMMMSPYMSGGVYARDPRDPNTDVLCAKCKEEDRTKSSTLKDRIEELRKRYEPSSVKVNNLVEDTARRSTEDVSYAATGLGCRKED